MLTILAASSSVEIGSSNQWRPEAEMILKKKKQTKRPEALEQRAKDETSRSTTSYTTCKINKNKGRVYLNLLPRWPKCPCRWTKSQVHRFRIGVYSPSVVCRQYQAATISNVIFQLISHMTTSLSFPPPFFHASPRPCRAYSRQSPIILLPLNSSPICSLRLSSNSFHQRIIRRLPPIMSSAISQSGITELSDESDFHSLLSPSGLISICGFGSLLSGTFFFSTSFD